MFHFEVYEAGALFGAKYLFPARGDGIGMHRHEPDECHNVIVLNGSIEVYGPDRCWSVTLNQGDTFDLGGDYAHHEIVALEPLTRTMHLVLNGKPDDELTAPEDRSGTIYGKPVTLPLSSFRHSDPA